MTHHKTVATASKNEDIVTFHMDGTDPTSSFATSLLTSLGNNETSHPELIKRIVSGQISTEVVKTIKLDLSIESQEKISRSLETMVITDQLSRAQKDNAVRAIFNLMPFWFRLSNEFLSKLTETSDGITQFVNAGGVEHLVNRVCTQSELEFAYDLLSKVASETNQSVHELLLPGIKRTAISHGEIFLLDKCCEETPSITFDENTVRITSETLTSILDFETINESNSALITSGLQIINRMSSSNTPSRSNARLISFSLFTLAKYELSPQQNQLLFSAAIKALTWGPRVTSQMAALAAVDTFFSGDPDLKSQNREKLQTALGLTNSNRRVQSTALCYVYLTCAIFKYHPLDLGLQRDRQQLCLTTGPTRVPVDAKFLNQHGYLAEVAKLTDQLIEVRSNWEFDNILSQISNNKRTRRQIADELFSQRERSFFGKPTGLEAWFGQERDTGGAATA